MNKLKIKMNDHKVKLLKIKLLEMFYKNNYFIKYKINKTKLVKIKMNDQKLNY